MGQRLYKRGDSPNWYVNLGGGKYASTGCRDKRAAEARARDLELAHRSPARPAQDAPTLAAALARAVADRVQRGRAAGTLHMWQIKCGQLLRVIGEDTPLDAITARTVDDYLTTRHGDGAADSTVAKEIGCLAVALKIARRRGEYSLDPAAVLPVELHRESKAGTRALTPEELRALLEDLRNDALPQRRRSMAERAAQVAFIVATSARWGEAERARREDVLLVDGGGFVTLRGTKTEGAARVVPILPTTAPLLRIALEHGGEGLLFSPWGNVRRDLHEACQRIGIPPCSPNDLRRTTATWLRNAGVEPHLIAAVLGHRDSRMVERVYGRLTPEALGAALLARVGATPAKKKKRAG